MNSFVKTLSGKKTYIVALLSAVAGVVSLVKSTHFTTTGVEAFIAAGGLASLRAAVAKCEAALKALK